MHAGPARLAAFLCGQTEDKKYEPLRINQFLLKVGAILDTFEIGKDPLTSSSATGKVKFYSADKGYGFIHDGGSGEDVFFHITAVVGADAPKTGDLVSFDVSPKDRNGRIAASRVEILEAAQSRDSQRSLPTLDGFPCIKGGSIAGFKVTRELGRVTVGNGIFKTYHSANEARDALINRARWRGANGIFNYVWYREQRRRSFSSKRIFGKGYNYHHINKDYFWCEGDAVLLDAIK